MLIFRGTLRLVNPLLTGLASAPGMRMIRLWLIAEVRPIVMVWLSFSAAALR